MLLQELIALAESEQLYVIEVPYDDSIFDDMKPLNLHSLHADPESLTPVTFTIQNSIDLLNRTNKAGTYELAHGIHEISHFEKSGKIWQKVVGELGALHEYAHYYTASKFEDKYPQPKSLKNDYPEDDPEVAKVWALEKAEEKRLISTIKPYRG